MTFTGVLFMFVNQDKTFPCDSFVSANPGPDRSSHVGEIKEFVSFPLINNYNSRCEKGCPWPI